MPAPEPTPRPTPSPAASVTQRDDSSRRRLVVLVGAVIAVLVAGVIALVSVGGDDPSGSADPSRPAGSTNSLPPSDAATDGPVGLPRRAGITFGSSLYALSSREIDRALDDVVSLHMRWIRIDLPWSGIQPVSRSRFDWIGVDTVVRAARERKLQVLALLSYTPSWARASGCRSFVCPPRDPDDFADFAAAAVERYAPRGVRTYQVWNEPNIDKFWRSPDPEAYGRLLRTTVSAMRDSASGLRILFGGLAFVGDRDRAARDGDVDAARFLRAACTDRGCPVDAVGYDPFTFPSLPSNTGTPLNAWQLIANRDAGTRSLRAAMSASGLGRRAVWVTAFGAPTGSGSGAVSDGMQARILRDGARLAGGARAVIGAYFVNTLLDDAESNALGARYGLVRADGTRKPAFAALQKALRTP